MHADQALSKSALFFMIDINFSKSLNIIDGWGDPLNGVIIMALGSRWRMPSILRVFYGLIMM